MSKKVRVNCPECGSDEFVTLSLTFSGHVVSLAGVQMKLEMQSVPQLWCGAFVEEDSFLCGWEQDGWIDMNGMACFTNPLKKTEDQG